MLLVANAGSSGTPRPFVPSLIQGLVLDLDGDLGVTVVDGLVTAWADQSGAGDPNRDAVATSDTQNPTLSATDPDFNGHSAIQFDATSNEQMVSVGDWSDAPVAAPLTIVIVGEDDNQAAVLRGYLANFLGGANWWFSNGGTPDRWEMFAGTVLASAMHADTNPNIYYLEVNNPSTSMRISEQTPDKVGDMGGGALSISRLRIGALSAAPGSGLTGKIARILVYSRLLTTVERLNLLAYCSTLYAIALGA